jgi:DNA (cytosine-5)-methyltransferase 1
LVTVGSLFSGCGGTALGFQRAGFRHAWFVENNIYAAATLRKNYPGTVVYGDITKVDFTTVPRVDVLEGGFPCQDISNAGKRVGITGSRSSLWKYYLEAIRVLRPRYVSIENVAALVRQGLDTVLADLASIGYDAEWHCIPASAVGAPHTRDRIFVLAYPNYSKQKYDSAAVPSSNETFWWELQRRILGTGSEVQTTEELGNTSGWWRNEPGMGRMAYGIPNRVDRIKCLGNAVVPQNAEVIAKAIMEKINAENN